MIKIIKETIQRIKYGCTDRETWNIDLELANFLLPRLKRYKQISMGYPSKYTEKAWNEILDTMIEGFELVKKHNTVDNMFILGHKNKRKIEKAYELISIHFKNLWW